MQDLTLDFAHKIYGAEYWPGLDEVENQAVASKILDLRVNFGVAGGNRIVQMAVNNLVEPPTAVDGRWGQDTLNSVNSCDPAMLLDELATVAAARYQAIANANPTQEVFLRGWLKRALDLPELGIVAGGLGLFVLLGIGALIWISRGGRA